MYYVVSLTVLHRRNNLDTRKKKKESMPYDCFHKTKTMTMELEIREIIPSYILALSI